MQALPDGCEPMLPPESELSAGLIEKHHPGRVKPGEERAEFPSSVFVSFYGTLSNFFFWSTSSASPND